MKNSEIFKAMVVMGGQLVYVYTNGLPHRTSMKKSVNASPAWSREVRAPLYHQLFLILRNKILSGEYPDGSLLPSEAELSATFDVSRITSKRALNEIAEAGFAVRQRGRGTRVLYKGGGTIVSGGLQGLRDSLRANARSAPLVLELGDAPAPAAVAAALNVEPGTIVQRALRIFAGDDRLPYSHLTTFVPSHIAAGWTRADLERHSLVALIERSGTKIESAEQIITATLADSDIANALQVSFASPLLKVTRTVYGRAGEPLEHLVALYPPGRYQFLMSLINDAEVSRWVI
jgi:GntR family transcriptional regulator